MTTVWFRMLLAALVLLGSARAAPAQDAASKPAESKPAASKSAETNSAETRPHIELPHLDIPALDGATTLTTHLFRPKSETGGIDDTPRPAVVMMHGCSGLLAPSGHFFGLYRAWARTLLAQGYVVLVVDSASSRGFGQTCSGGPQRAIALRERPGDAYAALTYLQAQPFVRADRIGLMGWSQGGGTVLLSINDMSIARPNDLRRDFAAAVAFYPGACSDQLQSKPYTRVEPGGWTTRVPLLALMGDADVWTPAEPCAAFLEAARARGNPVAFQRYPNAVHGFDAPNTPRKELPQYRRRNGDIPVIGTDREARADAFARVAAFLQEKLK